MEIVLRKGECEKWSFTFISEVLFIFGDSNPLSVIKNSFYGKIYKIFLGIEVI